MRLHYEKVLTPEGAALARHHFRGPVFDCPYHSHPEVEVLLIRNSHGRFLVGDGLGEFAPGDLFLFGPHLPHLFSNDPADSRGRDWARSDYIQFQPGVFGDGFWRLAELGAVSGVLDRSRDGLAYASRSHPELRRLFLSAHRARGAQAVGACLTLLEALARAPARRLTRDAARPVHRHEGRLGRVLDHLHARYRDPITLPEAARLAGMSPPSFSKFFKRHMSRTFRAYLIALRLSEVRKRLLESDVTITEAAYAAGFNNLANFNRCFKDAYGQPPRAFRTQL